MVDLKGTKTEENLKAALAGESQARVKYEFYASQAKKDGYVEIFSRNHLTMKKNTQKFGSNY